MTISPYGIGAGAAARADQSFRSIKGDLGSLQTELTTGKVATTYAGLGPGAATSLAVRAQLAGIAGYAGNVADAKLRVGLMSQGVGQIGTLAQALSVSLPTAYNQTPIGQTTAEVSAEDGLRQVIDVLNSEIGGRYLFAGRATDAAPVVPFDLMLNGDGTRAGLKQLVSERKQADLGASGLGRLTVAGSGTSVTLAEEAAGLPFGMKVAGVSATGAALTAATSAGPPAAATLGVASQPVDGDAVSLTLNLPDGTQTTVTLTARTAPGSGEAAFAIGATPATTAANLQAALTVAIGKTATTALASASTRAASAAFFAGSPSNPPVRVAGPPYAAATATVPSTAADTVIWYTGDDGAGSARETAPVRIGDGTAVAIGARANEPGFQAMLAAMGALAADSFPDTDPTAQARYSALAGSISTALGTGSAVDGVATELSVANVALGKASDRLAASKAQLQDALSGVEDADPNAVAMKLLATQTRLQASYQTTSLIAKLSLVDFL